MGITSIDVKLSAHEYMDGSVLRHKYFKRVFVNDKLVKHDEITLTNTFAEMYKQVFRGQATDMLLEFLTLREKIKAFTYFSVRAYGNADVHKFLLHQTQESLNKLNKLFYTKDGKTDQFFLGLAVGAAKAELSLLTNLLVQREKSQKVYVVIKGIGAGEMHFQFNSNKLIDVSFGSQSLTQNKIREVTTVTQAVPQEQKIVSTVESDSDVTNGQLKDRYVVKSVTVELGGVEFEVPLNVRINQVETALTTALQEQEKADELKRQADILSNLSKFMNEHKITTNDLKSFLNKDNS